MEALAGLLADYTLRTVAAGSAVLGLAAGVLGSFALLRRQSLLGDAVSHAALPGIVLAFLLTQSKSPLALALGAALAGWLATMLILAVVNNTRIKLDAAMGTMLAVFFGIGMVLLTVVQRLPDAGQAGLSTYLFGSASTMLRSDLVTVSVMAGAAVLLVLLCWKEIKLHTFNPEFAASAGFHNRLIDFGVATLIVVSIVAGLQLVGVVLMSALLVAPAAAARQWTNRLPVMVALAGGFGALSGIIGAVLSSLGAGIPAGPAIVLVATALVTLSLLFAPERGIAWAWLRHRRQHREVQVQAVLAGMLRLVETDEDPYRPHDIAALDAVGVHSAELTIRRLETAGLVKRAGSLWALTSAGLAEARNAARQGGAG
ncbi:MAG TPA: metal ABC transporter permease [Firmicutes bacterium]|nr:metal ABC transporter permease [Bacillota bacterium]